MMVSVIVCLLVAWASGNRADQHVTVELIEFNHFQKPGSSSGLDQVIFWRWNPTYARYEVRGWLSLESVQRISPNTILDVPRSPRGKSEGRYLIRGLRVRETSTDYDPEVYDKRLLADEYRDPMPWSYAKCR